MRSKACRRRLQSSSDRSQIVDSVMKLPVGSKLMILSPLVRGQKGEHKDTFGAIHKQGFVRARVDGEITELNGKDIPELKKTFVHNIEAIVDRIVLKPEVRSRIADSIETALRLSQGLTIITVQQDDNSWSDTVYSEKFACPLHPEVSLPELEPRLFSFNSPHGACPACHGLGTVNEFDADMIVPDESLSLETGAIEAWRKNGKRMNIWYSRSLRTFARDFGISYSQPYKEIPKKVRDVLMYGTDKKGDLGTGTEWEGVIPNLQRRFENTESDWVQHKLHNYMSEQPCPVCCGMRLKKEALAVRLHTLDGHVGGTHCDPGIELTRDTAVSAVLSDGNGAESSDTSNNSHGREGGVTTKGKAAKTAVTVPSLPGYSIDDVSRMTIVNAKKFFENLKLSEEGAQIAEPIMREIGARLGFMLDVGLGYLTLDRKTGSLSGGEAQRIRLATQVGSGLVGVCYVLDEPTIGLHQRDNARLIRTLRRLQQIGNTVIIVEHDEDCIRAADHMIDIGPGAGCHGGTLVAQGDVPQVFSQTQSTTIKYLVGELEIPTPKHRRRVGGDRGAIELKGCRENNLKNVDVKIPLGGLVCITGVSGSGKSTLINQTLLPALKRKLYSSRVKAGVYKTLSGINKIDKVIEIDQSPIGRTPRSNPATYTGVFDEIRKVFSKTREAKIRGYEAGRFSFNVKVAAAKLARGRASRPSRCTSCPTSKSPAKSATAPVTTPKRSRFTIVAKPSPTFST